MSQFLFRVLVAKRMKNQLFTLILFNKCDIRPLSYRLYKTGMGDELYHLVITEGWYTCFLNSVPSGQLYREDTRFTFLAAADSLKIFARIIDDEWLHAEAYCWIAGWQAVMGRYKEVRQTYIEVNNHDHELWQPINPGIFRRLYKMGWIEEIASNIGWPSSKSAAVFTGLAIALENPRPVGLKTHYMPLIISWEDTIVFESTVIV